MSGRRRNCLPGRRCGPAISERVWRVGWKHVGLGHALCVAKEVLVHAIVPEFLPGGAGTGGRIILPHAKASH